MDHTENQRVNSILSYILYFLGGSFILLGLIGFLPLHDMKYIYKMFLGEEQFNEVWVETPLFLYMIKYFSLAGLWMGGYFILFGKDPERYVKLINYSVAAMFVASLVILSAGVYYKLNFLWYFLDFLFLICGGFLLLAFKPKMAK